MVVCALAILVVVAMFSQPTQQVNYTFEPDMAQSGDNTSILAFTNRILGSVLFFDIAAGQLHIDKVDRYGNVSYDLNGIPVQKRVRIPLLLVVLICGLIIITVKTRYIGFRGFTHAIESLLGKHDKPGEEGEISHFAALMSALGQSVGLGNIAGVAVAVQLGGPGTIFWMVIYALFGMAARFASCTLAQLYRQVNPDGSISGGPMYYLELAFKGTPMERMGKILGISFAIVLLGGAVGGGNMFQSNQTVEALMASLDLGDSARWVLGLLMATGVALTVFGGLQTVAKTVSRIVPAMIVIYVLLALIVVISNLTKIPQAFGTMFSMAFSSNAFFGGTVGTLLVAAQRAAFSNGAGLGAASIPHAAAKTSEPVREGLVGMLAPFIDTVLICTLTGLVLVVTDVWNSPSLLASGHMGVSLAAEAFGSVSSVLPHVLTICVALFAFSTIVAWCYYGERACIYLSDKFDIDGELVIFLFRSVFVAFVFFGAVNELEDVITFSDMAILSMGLPNIIGTVILLPRVREALDAYTARYF